MSAVKHARKIIAELNPNMLALIKRVCNQVTTRYDDGCFEVKAIFRAGRYQGIHS